MKLAKGADFLSRGTCSILNNGLCHKLRRIVLERRLALLLNSIPTTTHCSIFRSIMSKTPRYVNLLFQPRVRNTPFSSWPHPHWFTFGCKPSCRKLEVTVRWSQQEHIVCKKQKQHPEATEPDTCHNLAEPWNSELNQWQRAALTEINPTYPIFSECPHPVYAGQVESAHAFLVGTKGLTTCFTDKHFHLVSWQHSQGEKNPQWWWWAIKHAGQMNLMLIRY